MSRSSREWRYLGGIGTFAEMARLDSVLTGELAFDGLILPVVFLPGEGGKRPFVRIANATTGEELGALWSKSTCLSGQMRLGNGSIGVVAHSDRRNKPGSAQWRAFQLFALEHECRVAEATLEDTESDDQYADPF